MVALAYTATIGFKSIAFGRERVTADALADQIMETIREAFSTIQTGLSSSDLSDPNIVSGCAGDAAGVYRFQTCSGEQIITSGGVPSTAWVNPPHRHDRSEPNDEQTSVHVGDLYHQQLPCDLSHLRDHEPVSGHGNRPLGQCGLSEYRDQRRADPEPLLVPQRMSQLLDTSFRGAVPAVLRPGTGAGRSRRHHRIGPGSELHEWFPRADGYRVEPPKRASDARSCVVLGVTGLCHRRRRDKNGRRYANNRQRCRLRPGGSGRDLRQLIGGVGSRRVCLFLGWLHLDQLHGSGGRFRNRRLSRRCRGGQRLPSPQPTQPKRTIFHALGLGSSKAALSTRR